MSIEGPKSILCVGAHPDDIEMMAGGSVARWVGEGRAVRFLTFTNGVWQAPSGAWQRDPEEARAEGEAAAASLGVEVENLMMPAMDLQWEDRLVVEVLRRIEAHQIDTLICPWDRDLHHDHETVSRIVVSASRRVPRVLMGCINYYLREIFTPNLFVDISDTWDAKMKAMACFRKEWERAKDDWEPWLDDTSRTYGRMLGVQRAEGFIVHKYLL